jgi:hypothetical protein
MSVLIRNLARLFSTGTQPATTAAADVWWRSDLSQAHASDGASGIPLRLGPDGNLPVIRSTGWHNLPPQGNPGTATVPADRLFALPFWPGRSCTLTAAAVNVTLALVGGNIRMGVYASDGTVPTSLVADYGTVSVGVTGVRQISGLSTALRPVLHYVVVARQGGALNLGLSSRDTWDPIVSETSPLLDANRNAYYRDGVSGALPASFGAIAGAIQGPSATIQLT